MASSRKSKRNSAGELEVAVGAVLKPLLVPRARLVLGLSGGLDSVVLLDVLHQLSRPLGFTLACVHVDHGISSNARRWAAFCARKCKRLAVALDVHHVDVGPYHAEGLEAAARRARYAVYARQQCEFIVLAQHLDDQAETLLLQLLRGAGVKGGAAMPAVRQQGRGEGGKAARSPAILRPMLALSRRQIEAYARARGLRWVEDESNADTRRDRNFLRHEVLPVIERAFPGYRATLSRAAGHLAEASQMLDQLAESDARIAVNGNKIVLAELKRIGADRAKNLLRWLLCRQGDAAPEADRLGEALRQLFQARADASVLIALGAHELRRYAGCAYLLRSLPEAPLELWRPWDGKRVWPLPELGGTLHFVRRPASGLDCAMTGAVGLCVGLRRGGEKLRLRPGAATRSLKNLLQEAHLPPWERERLPLIYCTDTLVAVPGVGVASDWQAGAGKAGWTITWQRQE